MVYSFDMGTLLFMLNSTIGALINVLLWSQKIGDLTKWRSIRTILVGALVGYVYWWGHISEHLPDGFMAIVVGYTAEDFMNWVISKFQPKQ